MYKPGETILPPVSRRRSKDDENERRLLEELGRMATEGPSSSSSGRSGQTHRERSRDRRDHGHGHRRRQEEGRNREGADDRLSEQNVQGSARQRQPTTAPSRQIEHQSSLRSLLSASDFDVSDIEEEIARQIVEEGLLDGIDLSVIGAAEEEAIRERIDEAYRRRQRTRPAGPPRRSSDGDRALARASDGERRRRAHSRSQSTSVQNGEGGLPPPPPTQVVGPSGRTERRRRRSIHSPTTGSPMPPSGVQGLASSARTAAARSATDLSYAPRSSPPSSNQPAAPRSDHGRRTTDPDIGSAGLRQRSSEQISSPSEQPEPMPTLQVPVERTDGMLRIGGSPSAASSTRTTDPARAVRMEQSRSARNPAEVSESNGRPSSAGHQASTAIPSTGRTRPVLYPEPSIMCHRCERPDIQYELHYNCLECDDGDYNLCLSCYRQGRGCKHWYGFGWAAWSRYERLSPAGGYPSNHPLPHTLTGHRFLRPTQSPVQAMVTASPAANDSPRRSLTAEDPLKRLQAGVFCSVCAAYTNACYWKCDVCNDGEWGFCHRCVSTGKCCTHPLLPLVYVGVKDHTTAQQQHLEGMTSQGPGGGSGMTLIRGVSGTAEQHGPLRAVTIATSCNICRLPIPPFSERYHCFHCNEGDYDICWPCYFKLCSNGKINPQNGFKGWRRCLRGHRMTVVGFEDQDGVGSDNSGGGSGGGNIGSNSGGGGGAKRRIIVQDLVGGLALKDEGDPSSSSSPSASNPTLSSESNGGHNNEGGPKGNVKKQKADNWIWREGPNGKRESKIITKGIVPLQSSTLSSSSSSATATITGATTPIPSSSSPSSPSNSNTNPRPNPRPNPNPNMNSNENMTFPPDGGVGMRVLARWSHYPASDVTDELMFPRNAEIREVEDINGDWYWGCYAGSKGLFPGPYVVVLDLV